MPRLDDDDDDGYEERKRSGSVSDVDLNEVIDALEDLVVGDLMPQDLWLGDDDGGGESKGNDEEEEEEEKGGGGDSRRGDAFLRRLIRICREALPSFISAAEEAGDKDECEWRIEHTEHHERFRACVEDRLTAEIEAYDLSISDFTLLLEDATKQGKDRRLESGARILLELIDIVSKFENFALGMRIRAVQFLSKAEEFDFGRRL